MPGAVKFDFKGGKELEAALKALGPKPARKLAGRALKAAATVIVKEAKRLVPVDPNSKHERHLRDALTARVARATKDNQRIVGIGAEQPESRRLHLVEFGTSHSAAKPFLRPAFDTKAEEALDVMGKKLGEDIEKEAAKLAQGNLNG